MSKKRFNPKSYPLAVRDKVEIDYARKLSREEQNWLAAFNEAEYGSNPDCMEEITGRPATKEERRKAWRDIKRYERDALSGKHERRDGHLAATPTRPTYRPVENVMIEILDAFEETKKKP